jgi:hypothetical protein
MHLRDIHWDQELAEVKESALWSGRRSIGDSNSGRTTRTPPQHDPTRATSRQPSRFTAPHQGIPPETPPHRQSAFIGVAIFGQAFVFDAGAPSNLSMSPGVELWIG